MAGSFRAPVERSGATRGARVDIRGVEHHRRLIRRNASLRGLPAQGPPVSGRKGASQAPSLLMRPRSAPARQSHAQGVYSGGSQQCIYNGATVFLQRQETRQEVVQRMHLERAKENDRRHHLRWSLLHAFLKACESHFMPNLSRRDTPLGFSYMEGGERGREGRRTKTIVTPLIDQIGDLLLADVVDQRVVSIGRGRSRGQAQRISSPIFAMNSNDTQPVLTPPPVPRAIKRDKFMLVIQRHGLNFPASMATQFWDMMAQGDVLDLTVLLCSLRLLINATAGADLCVAKFDSKRRVESIETKLEGLFEIYEKHCGKIDKLERIFAIAAKSWEEQKAIRDILDQRFSLILTAIIHERDKFSSNIVTREALPRLTLTEEVFNDARGQYPRQWQVRRWKIQLPRRCSLCTIALWFCF